MFNLEDKIKFNRGRGTPFSAGYLTGVKVYQSYSKKDSSGRKKIKAFIDSCSSSAKNGDEFNKGLMCGVRDAANERKSKSTI